MTSRSSSALAILCVAFLLVVGGPATAKQMTHSEGGGGGSSHRGGHSRHDNNASSKKKAESKPKTKPRTRENSYTVEHGPLKSEKHDSHTPTSEKTQHRKGNKNGHVFIESKTEHHGPSSDTNRSHRTREQTTIGVGKEF